MNTEKAIQIIKNLKDYYPDAKCSLDFSTPFEMLVAVCLSAQCTDDRVNKTTPSLFARFDTPQDFANADINELESIIHPCGFYKNKARNLKLAGQKIINDFNGIVPHTMDELITIPGVGRKSANVIMLEAFGIAEGIAVDTHAKRISNRIGLSNESEPEKIEQDLIKIFPKETLKDINHLFMWLGRNTCEARNPHCDSCSVKQFCEFYKKNNQGYT